MYLHRLLLAIFFAGNLGTITELVFLEHYEDTWQRVPLAVVLIGVIVGGWYAATGNIQSRRWFRTVLGLFALSGAVGLWLHFRGNLEFAREQDASLRGFPLLWEVLTGATPALAPGMMIFLAVIGHAVTLARDSPLATPRS